MDKTNQRLARLWGVAWSRALIRLFEFLVQADARLALYKVVVLVLVVPLAPSKVR